MYVFGATCISQPLDTELTICFISDSIHWLDLILFLIMLLKVYNIGNEVIVLLTIHWIWQMNIHTMEYYTNSTFVCILHIVHILHTVYITTWFIQTQTQDNNINKIHVLLRRIEKQTFTEHNQKAHIHLRHSKTSK